MPANQMRTVKDVPLESAGVAGSFMQVGQRLGNAMGIAIGTSIYFALSNEGTETAFRAAFAWAMVFVIAVGVVAVIIAALDFAAQRRSARAARDLG